MSHYSQCCQSQVLGGLTEPTPTPHRYLFPNCHSLEIGCYSSTLLCPRFPSFPSFPLLYSHCLLAAAAVPAQHHLKLSLQVIDRLVKLQFLVTFPLNFGRVVPAGVEVLDLPSLHHEKRLHAPAVLPLDALEDFILLVRFHQLVIPADEGVEAGVAQDGIQLVGYLLDQSCLLLLALLREALPLIEPNFHLRGGGFYLQEPEQPMPRPCSCSSTPRLQPPIGCRVTKRAVTEEV